MAFFGSQCLFRPTLGSSVARIISSPLRTAWNIKTISKSTSVVPRWFSATSASQKSWTEEENKKLTEFLKQGKTTVEFTNHFPDRTVLALESKMTKIRKILKLDDDPFPSKHKKSNIKFWTVEQDKLLIDAVNKFKDDWQRIAEEGVNGERIGRSPTSCRRRWMLIREDFKTGVWEPEEDRRLKMAIWSQVAKRTNQKVGRSVPESLFQDKDLTKIDWKEVCNRVGTRSDSQCRSHVFKALLSKKKGPWDESETAQLVGALKVHGLNWNKLAEVVKTRSAFQIKQKYYISKGMKMNLSAEGEA